MLCAALLLAQGVVVGALWAAEPPPVGTGPGPAMAPPPAAEPAAPPPPSQASADCTDSEGCFKEGLCTAEPTGCVAGSDADCARAWVCAAEGRCTARGYGCVVGSDAGCMQSQACRERGACGMAGGACVPRIDEHCRRSQQCAGQGLCRLQAGACEARIDEDCRQAAVCEESSRCKAFEGGCVAWLPQDGAAGERSGSRGLHAFEVLPMVAVNFSGAPADPGFFGEAFFGMRLFAHLGVHLGIGYGTYVPDSGVLLASLVPQIHLLPQDYPVDLVLGVPLGYYNHGIERVVAEDGELFIEEGRLDGFHVGALAAAMVELGGGLSVGPVIRYSRFVAEFSEGYYTLGVGGRYAVWLEPDESGSASESADFKPAAP